MRSVGEFKEENLRKKRGEAVQVKPNRKKKIGEKEEELPQKPQKNPNKKKKIPRARGIKKKAVSENTRLKPKKGVQGGGGQNAFGGNHEKTRWEKKTLWAKKKKKSEKRKVKGKSRVKKKKKSGIHGFHLGSRPGKEKVHKRKSSHKTGRRRNKKSKEKRGLKKKRGIFPGGESPGTTGSFVVARDQRGEARRKGLEGEEIGAISKKGRKKALEESGPPP